MLLSRSMLLGMLHFANLALFASNYIPIFIPLPWQAFSTVGTPDYIAPEVLLKKGYSLECDWLVFLKRLYSRLYTYSSPYNCYYYLCQCVIIPQTVLIL